MSASTHVGIFLQLQTTLITYKLCSRTLCIASSTCVGHLTIRLGYAHLNTLSCQIFNTIEVHMSIVVEELLRVHKPKAH